MSSSVSTTAGNVVVVTHVHPLSQTQHVHATGLSTGNQKFNKVFPLALGTVQIMIGVMVLLFGIVSPFYGPSLGLYSGIFVWGAVLYISSGSVTIAAARSGTKCLINGSMGLNISAAVVSLVGVILYALDTFMWGRYNFRNNEGYSGVLAVFQFLELIVSIVVASGACNATCSCCAEPQTHFIPAPAAPLMNVPAFPSYQAGAVAPAPFSTPALPQTHFIPAPAAPLMNVPAFTAYQAAPALAPFSTPAPVMDYTKNPNNGHVSGGPPAYDAPIQSEH